MFHLLQHVLIFEWNKQAYSHRSHLHLTPLIKHIKRQLNPAPFRQHFLSAHKSRGIEASEDGVTGGEIGHRLYIKKKKKDDGCWEKSFKSTSQLLVLWRRLERFNHSGNSTNSFSLNEARKSWTLFQKYSKCERKRNYPPEKSHTVWVSLITLHTNKPYNQLCSHNIIMIQCHVMITS